MLPDGFIPLSLVGPLPRAPRTRRHVARAGAPRQSHRHCCSRARHRRRRHADAGRTPAAATWAREEIWSFASNDVLRIAAAEGADGIDPAQANVPPTGARFPAFRMDKDSKLSVVERSRGIANADDNRLSLIARPVAGFRSRRVSPPSTSITGHHAPRLAARHAGALRARERAAGPATSCSSRKALRAPPASSCASPEPSISPRSSRKTAGSAMPATGWDQRFDRVVGNTAPAAGPSADRRTRRRCRARILVGAVGHCGMCSAWRWSWCSSTGPPAGSPAADRRARAAAHATRRRPEYLWMWGNLLAALARGARRSPKGSFGLLARAWRTLEFRRSLGLALLPFLDFAVALRAVSATRASRVGV